MLRAREKLLAYGCAVLATFLVNLVWLALPRDWGEHIPFSLFLLVVGGVSLLGGFGPGSLALVLGGFSAWYFGNPRFAPGARLYAPP